MCQSVCAESLNLLRIHTLSFRTSLFSLQLKLIASLHWRVFNHLLRQCLFKDNPSYLFCFAHANFPEIQRWISKLKNLLIKKNERRRLRNISDKWLEGAFDVPHSSAIISPLFVFVCVRLSANWSPAVLQALDGAREPATNLLIGAVRHRSKTTL